MIGKTCIVSYVVACLFPELQMKSWPVSQDVKPVSSIVCVRLDNMAEVISMHYKEDSRQLARSFIVRQRHLPFECANNPVSACWLESVHIGFGLVFT